MEVRGNPTNGGSKFVQIQEEGIPVLPYGDIAFGNTDMFTRLDNSIRTVESIRGGSASILNSTSGGGIINNISKTGSVSTEVGLDYSRFRTDFDYGARIADDMMFHIGGFYRTDEGVRSAGYTANQGGQFKANFTKQFDKGYVRVYLKHLDDRTIPYIPIPFARTGDINSNEIKVESLEGFDGTHGTFHSVDLLRFKGRSPNGGFVEESIQEGMNPNLFAHGVEFDFDLGNDWTMNNKMRKSFIDHQFNGIFSWSAYPETAVDFAISKGVADPVFSYASGFNSGTPLTTDVLKNLNGNGLVVEYGYWHVDLDMDYFVNDLVFNKRFDDIKGNLTLGYFHSQFNAKAEWWFHNFLADVSDNTRRLNLVDKSTTTSLTDDGFTQFGVFYRNWRAGANINAPYVNFDFEPIENLNVSAGIRLDMGSIVGQLSNIKDFDYDVNGDGTISAAETGVTHQAGSHIPFDFNYEQFSYSAGLNYKFSDNMAAFFRHSQGSRYNFDRAFENATIATKSGYPDTEKDGERIIQYELGTKFRSKNFGIFATGFHTRYPDDNFSELVSQNGKLVNVSGKGLIKVTGVEIDAKGAYENFSLAFNGTFFSRVYGDGRVVNSGTKEAPKQTDLSGKKTPGVKSFFTITPEWQSKDKKFFINSNIMYRGKLDNNDFDDTYFPSYTAVNASAGVRFGKVTVAINGSNYFQRTRY
jgi:hypothetical protein